MGLKEQIQALKCKEAKVKSIHFKLYLIERKVLQISTFYSHTLELLQYLDYTVWKRLANVANSAVSDFAPGPPPSKKHVFFFVSSVGLPRSLGA